MAKKRDFVDELSEYQRQQYLPHAQHIQNGELPFRARQLMKQTLKKNLHLFFVAVPASFVVVVMLQQWLQLPQDRSWILLVGWLGVLAIAFVLILRGEVKRQAAKKNIRKKKNKK